MSHEETSHEETSHQKTEPMAETPSALPTTSGPLKTFTVGETHYTLLGTAHVSAESAEDVRKLIDSGAFDAVAIELCELDLQLRDTHAVSTADRRSIRHSAGG